MRTVNKNWYCLSFCLFFCWGAIAYQTSKEFKACYVANMRAENSLWIKRTLERRDFTRKQKYYRKNKFTKKNYENWFKGELDKHRGKKKQIALLTKKYGEANENSSLCKSYAKYYFNGDDFESSL